MLDLAPVEMNAVLRAQLSSYRREPRDLHGLLDRIGSGGAPQFAAEFGAVSEVPDPPLTSPAAA